METRPAITMTMERTNANLGRSIKKLLNIRHFSTGLEEAGMAVCTVMPGRTF